MTPTYQDITRLLGDLDDHTVAQIEGSGATLSELEEIAAHLAQETDVMGDLRKPLTGRALTVYTLLRQQEAQWDEER
ncbi:hypothetical protein [Sulfitobacter sabulilitoris]|uniref:Uncharacterized protein n=1 Tax=Sulfitobacter sabulilitoris TaxID=2562655 RepID=A0A5S3PNY5_9RHOB|nr:hypothetical protein [Sulfitobacter sabulilitoris]TMM54225.1 hypothetical protein FDT80_01100 [Sulfitobacter sabulilitoris]